MKKPVAWIWSEDGYNIGVCLDQDKQMGKEFEQYTIPLYTHPVKELSGVEIIGMSGKYDFTYDVHIIEFARALLRKAQEK